MPNTQAASRQDGSLSSDAPATSTAHRQAWLCLCSEFPLDHDPWRRSRIRITDGTDSDTQSCSCSCRKHSQQLQIDHFMSCLVPRPGSRPPQILAQATQDQPLHQRRPLMTHLQLVGPRSTPWLWETQRLPVQGHLSHSPSSQQHTQDTQ